MIRLQESQNQTQKSSIVFDAEHNLAIRLESELRGKIDPKFLDELQGKYPHDGNFAFDIHKSFFMQGPVGTRKTYTLNALLMQGIKKHYQRFKDVEGRWSEDSIILENNTCVPVPPFPGLILNWDEFIAKISGMYPDEQNEWIDRIKRVPFLFIDDLGTDKNTSTDISGSALFRIVNYKDQNNGYIGITANTDLLTACRGNKRVHDRIKGMTRLTPGRGSECFNMKALPDDLESLR